MNFYFMLVYIFVNKLKLTYLHNSNSHVIFGLTRRHHKYKLYINLREQCCWYLPLTFNRLSCLEVQRTFKPTT
jgi:hypothetical protein